MEPISDSINISRDRIFSGAAETSYAPRIRHGTKLRDVLMSDKPNLSYADFHHELTRNPDSALPNYEGRHQSQVFERRNLKEEELVRYMSHLPSYLEKGKNYQERALNVGVLDWRHLEKWRCSQQQMPLKHDGHSPSSSNTSLFSTDGSSTHSSRGQSSSPARQRLQRRSLQPPMEASSKGHVQDSKSSSIRGQGFSPVGHKTRVSMPQSHPQKVYTEEGMPLEIEVFGGNVQKFQDSTVSTDKYLRRQHKVSGAVCERKGSDLKSVSEIGRKSIPDKYEGAATWKGKKKIQDVESAKETGGRLGETKLNGADRGWSDREKSGIVILPRDPLEHTRSGFTGLASFTANDRLSVEPGEKFLLARNNLEGRLPSSNGSYNQLELTEFCSQHEVSIKNVSQAQHISLQSTSKIHTSPSSIKVQGVKPPTEAPHVPSFPTRMFSSPSRNRDTHEKKPAAEMGRETAAKPSEVVVRKASEPIPKARNPSPIRRLSSAMGKMIKSAGSRENSPLRRSGTKDCTAKSGPEAADSSSFTDNPCSDKFLTNNSRGRSSPLRRLLDPLLKPRVSNCSEPSNKLSSSVIGSVKSSNKQLDSHPGHFVEVNLRSASAAISASDAHHSSKNASSTFQSLLQVSFKNGLPLFTFAIDNESNILAATVRKSSSPAKGHRSWIYTFFAIREVKRKSGGWLNQGGKSGNHGYVPNVVAQMKVSDSCSSSIKHENADDLVSREFDLFAVDVEQGDECSTDFHPTDEIAAIIVKIPKIATTNSSKGDNSSYDWLDLSNINSCNNSQLQHSLLTRNLSTSVVLPSGLHTVPSKGEISRLAQRWRSGGLCDCGGWDLGCQLRVYTNKKEYETTFDSSGICHIKDKLQLFSQVGQDNQPVLSLAPFKERIYSVEFSSSFSLLQAFAVSVSFIDCRRPPDILEPNNVLEKVSAEVGVFEVPIRSKMSNQAEAPGRYVSYPPHSPVGRV